MVDVYINGQLRRLSPNSAIGKGGEADVYDLGSGTALKLYKQPNDPDYLAIPDSNARATAQAGANERLREQQHKLVAFPKGLHSRVMRPLDLAWNKNQSEVRGFTMRYLQGMEVLLSYSNRNFREKGGIDANRVVALFSDLREIVEQLHTNRVVIGDFNDLNVLVDGKDQAYLVDADSMQFGKFVCHTFTSRFLDPLHSDGRSLIMARPHNPGSDWYAFNVMLFQSLLYVSPYGGIHRPKTGKRLHNDDRVLARISVFDPEVQYPKPALDYNRLPDDLLEYFQKVYKGDRREAFPEGLLMSLRWTTCNNCGATHARPRCPACATTGIVKQTVVIRGKVTATRVFRTPGHIVFATYQAGKLRYLVHNKDEFRREDSKVVVEGRLHPELRFRINRETTLLGKKERLLVFKPESQPTVETTEVFGGNLSMFDANSHNYFWLQNGQLVKSGRLGAEFIGDILSNRTLFWAGEQFGFGFYQAGKLLRAFVFDVKTRGINDQVPIKTMPGQLIDAVCVFSDTLAWFMASFQDSGKLVNRCYVINKKGQVIAEAQASQDEDNWLAKGIRGRFAGGTSLYVATDAGIVRVTAENGDIDVTQSFPDTEQFVDDTSQLFSGDGGIYAVSTREVYHLTIK